MMGFREQLEAIKNFVETEYPGHLEDHGISAPFVTTEFIDFDRFKNDFCLFIEFDGANFAPSPFADDCGQVQRLQANIVIAFRNDTATNLYEKLMDASTALRELLRDEKVHKERLAIADDLTVKAVDWFKYVEGNRHLVASKFSLEFEMQI